MVIVNCKISLHLYSSKTSCFTRIDGTYSIQKPHLNDGKTTCFTIVKVGKCESSTTSHSGPSYPLRLLRGRQGRMADGL